ncbi:NUMOD4 domain-containing protein [Flavobacterium sp. U410]
MSHFIIEEWKEFVPEGLELKKRYLVSNLGRVKSCEQDLKTCQVLKGSPTDGYFFLKFSRIVNGKKKQYPYSYHFLVASLFIPKDHDGQTHVLHLDYDRKNNRIDNLKWATYDEMIEHGKKSPYVKEAKLKLIEFNKKRDGHKLTVNDVIRLKRKLFDPNRKTRNKILAKQFGITEMQLYRIKSGENWGHVKVDIKGAE